MPDNARPPKSNVDARRIWIDGKLVPWHDATVHVLSQSIQRGSLVFDLMSCHWLEAGPVVFGLREHVDRFLRSAELSGMRFGLDREGLLRAIGDTVRANPGAEQVKLSGYYPSPSLDVLPRDPRAVIAIAAYRPEEIDPNYKRERGPASLQVADPRKMPGWVQSPQAKLAAGYLYTSIAKARARAAGFDDVLLLDEAGNVAESSTMNFFWVFRGDLYTAPLDVVLAGVTRGALAALAGDEGLEIREQRLPLAVLDEADEAFVTVTSAGVWPVGRVDDRRWPAPGPVTARLMERMRGVLEGKDARFSPIWMQPV